MKVHKYFYKDSRLYLSFRVKFANRTVVTNMTFKVNKKDIMVLPIEYKEINLIMY